MAIDHKRIHENGWLQGSIFTAQDSAELLAAAHWHPLPEGHTLPADTRLVVVSHSCDVVSRSPLEQYVEVCPAAPLVAGETIGQLGYARDPRKLRLAFALGGQIVLHELSAPLRFVISRSILEDRLPTPDAALAREDLDHYTFWLSARVRRRTFPNAFDERIGTGSHKSIRKALSKVQDDIEALMYSLSTEKELDKDSIYRIRIMLLAKPEALADVKKIEALETARDKIEDILSDKEGVEVEVVDLASSASTSVATASAYLNWGFEDLSLEADSV